MMFKRLSLWAFVLTTFACCLWTVQLHAAPSEDGFGETPTNLIEDACPDIDFTMMDMGDCCYHFEAIDPIDFGIPDCMDWKITDAAGNVLVSGPMGFALDFCFPASGLYQICFTGCCQDAAGGLAIITTCKDLQVDCGGCVPDPSFAITDLGDCCYHFGALNPDPGTENCASWEILDAAGNHLVTGVFGTAFDHCFTTSGTYTICYVTCCTLPDGTQVFASHCEDLVVECGCEVDPNFTVTQDGCVYTYTITNNTTTPDDQLCAYVDVLGGIVPLADATWTIDFSGQCTGYGFCFSVFCCDEGYDPDLNLTLCADFVIDCCCTPDPLFAVDPIDNCCYVFADLTPEDDPNDPCDLWEIIDASGNVIATHTGEFFEYCFTGSGAFQVCHTDCCINADGTIIDSRHCIDLSVDCAPCVPDPFFVVDQIDDCCYAFADQTPEPDPFDPCDKWEIFDNAGNTISTSIGEFYEYCFPMSGVYVVCYTDCCLNPDGSITELTYCIDLEVICDPCVPDPLFSITDLGDCCYHFEDLTPSPDANNCAQWEIIDPLGVPVVVGAFGQAFDHCFTVNGTYTICYTDCCLNPDGTYTYATHCEDLDVNCQCEPYDLAEPIFSTIVSLDCQTVTMAFSINPVDGYCVDFVFDGVIYNAVFDATMNTYFVTFPFPCNGDYEGEVIVYCCDDPTTAVSQLVQFTLDSDCCCDVPDFDFSWGYSTIPGCDGCAIGFNCPVLPDTYCVSWDFGDGSAPYTVANSCPIHCFEDCGVYEVCLTVYCCDNPNITKTVCHSVEADCCCTPDPHFAVDPMQDCCYAFADLTPESDPNDPCDIWEVFDAAGNVIHTQTGEFMDYCFPGSGFYVVCYTDCCVNPDGTITEATHCEEFQVDCCTPDPFFAIDPMQDCCYAFADLTPEFDPNDPCDKWEVFDAAGNLIHSATGEFMDYCFPGSGFYVVCYTDCCVNPDGTLTEATHCEELQVDCCTPDPLFVIDPMQDCCYAFADATPESDPNDPCDLWEIYDPSGNLIHSAIGEFMDYCFPGSGLYVVCYTDCCVNPDGTINSLTHCEEIDVDCCTPDPLFAIDPMQDCCYAFADLTPENDPVDPCDRWEVFDAAGNLIHTAFGEFMDYCFPGSGFYVVCYTDCCINPDGTLTEATHCEELQVDCCTPDAHFNWDYTQDCCYVFADLTPELDSPNDPCDTWEVFDIFGNLIATAQGDIFTYCFDLSGTYVICHTDCCVLADGTIIQDVQCIDLQVDCCTVPDFDFSWSSSTVDLCPNGGCTMSFTCPALDPDLYCTEWDMGDGTIIAGSPVCPIHCYEECGVYTVCLTVYCCEDPSQSVTVCHDVLVDCCCTPDPEFEAIDEGNCCWTFTDTTPDGDPFGPCDDWVIYDALGVPIFFNTGESISYCFDTPGTYTICNTDCCENLDGTVTDGTFCMSIDVNCCEVPTDINFDWTMSGDCPNGDGCMVGFNCPQPMLDPDQYCVTWDFGDGHIEDYPTDVCPIHCYTDCGIYEVCMTVYCCDDPTQSVTVCHEVLVDCCCQVPADADFTWLQTDPDKCEYGFCPTGSGDLDELCVHWDFGDGTFYDGPFAFCPVHEYTDCGIYNVCMTVYCCEDPNETVTICHEIEVDCCCTVPDFISFTYFGTNGPDCQAGFCLDQILDPNKYCSTWYWGDGTQSDHPVDVCPVHNYECDGIYEVCVDVYCCDDPNMRVTACQAIEVDCECNLPTNVDFDLTVDDDCNVTGNILLPLQTCPDEICWSWSFGDGTGQMGGANFAHTYAVPGVYQVCLEVFCCDDPSMGYVICMEIEVNCCTVPDFISFTYFGASGANCQAGFCLDQVLDPDLYCSTWYWGDGTQSDHPVNECPVHNYECDGIYEVCVDVYCCDDPNVRVTSCQEIEVDCECNLPTNVDFALNSDENCVASGSILLPIQTCPDEICWSWDFGDGTSQVGGDAWTHTYATSGVYTVCLNVYCCDDTSIGYTICKEIDIYCPPCDLPSGIGFDYSVDQCTVTTSAFYTDDYDGNICFEWTWGDGSLPTPGEMATHTYMTSGTYTVCLTVFCCDDPSISMTYCEEITVECPGDCPEPCELNARYLWEMFPITQADGCCMQFFDLSVAGTYTTITSWTWDFGDGTTSNLQNPLHCWDTPGTHTVCLTITGSSPDGQCSDTFCWEVMCDCEDTCPADLNGDGFVNLTDLLVFLGQYNQACP